MTHITDSYYRFCSKMVWFWAIYTLWVASFTILLAAEGKEWLAVWNFAWFCFGAAMFIKNKRILSDYKFVGKFNGIPIYTNHKIPRNVSDLVRNDGSYDRFRVDSIKAKNKKGANE